MITKKSEIVTLPISYVPIFTSKKTQNRNIELSKRKELKISKKKVKNTNIKSFWNNLYTNNPVVIT